ncbi:MAG: alpha-glycosidase [Clostridiales bacterium]|nr:alpha-glycosidase [Clostridiales bacterium]
MNKHALYHKSDGLYAFALDGNTVELRLRAAHGDLNGVTLVYGKKHEFCKERKSMPVPFSLTDGMFDYYTVRLKLDDKRLAYVFVLTDTSGKKYYYSEDGATESYDYSTAYYNFFQLAYVNKNDVMPYVDWLGNAVVYQIFPDRFAVGEPPHGEQPSSVDKDYINLEWGRKPTPKSFAGGNLWGVAQKLDYLRDLGVNTLYLTPIFTSRSNHKYDISDYYNVDPHFGGNVAFKHLMNECKKRGVRVILDAVFNHCSDELLQFKDVCEKGGKSKYRDWFVINGDKPTKRPRNYEVFAECDYMPKWNTANPEVQEYLCAVGEHWINEYGIDGWRLDVSDEVSHEFWRKFRKRIKALGEDKVLIGENWHDSRSYLRGEQFDSIMNYAFTKAMLDFFAKREMDAQGFCDKLNGLLMRNSTQVNGMMLNLIDCHDTHRFYTLCGCDEKKLLCALAVELFMPGAAMVYYGTEIPLEGGYDPDSRRCFIWGEHEFTPKVKKLLGYKRLKSLGGCDAKLTCENGLFIVEREAAGEKTVLLVNNTDNKLTARGTTVEPYDFKIIRD